MNCTNVQLWRPLPEGSKIVISAEGDENLFNVAVGVNVNGSHETTFRHEEIVPGPKTRTINKDERLALHVFVSVFHDPEAANPVVLKAHVERRDGTTHPQFDCVWSFAHAGQFPITIFATNK